MKLLFDFFPAIIFFICYKWQNIFVATTALMIATGLQLIISWVVTKKIQKVHAVTFLLVMVFGSLTLFFHDDTFIKWKVTVIYLLMAVGFLVSDLVFNKPLIKTMLSGELQLPDFVYRKLTYSWAGFFIGCAVLNLYIAFRMSQAAWVNFKVFGLTGLTLLLALGTGVYLYRHMSAHSQSS